MNREVQVRFCESRGVQLPPATRPFGSVVGPMGALWG